MTRTHSVRHWIFGLTALAALALVGITGTSLPPANSVTGPGANTPSEQAEHNGQSHAGAPKTKEGDPVNMATGGFEIDETVLSIAGRGMDFNLALRYSSVGVLDSETGRRWTNNWNQCIRVEPYHPTTTQIYGGPGDTLGGRPIEPTGSAHTGSGGGSSTGSVGGGSPGGSGGSPPAVGYNVVYYPGDNRADRFQPDQGDLWYCPGYFDRLLAHHSLGTTAPTGFEMRRPNGTVLTFDLNDQYTPWASGCSTWWLTKVEDRKGNLIRLYYEIAGAGSTAHHRLSRVVDTLGRVIEFRYNSVSPGWLESVSDFTGRTIRLTHDAEGKLTSITGPAIVGTSTGNDFPEGKTERYEYGTDAQRYDILRAFGPGSAVPYLQNFYNGAHQVIRQFFGGPKTVNGQVVQAGGLHRFYYESASFPARFAATESKRTLAVDPNGIATLRCFSAAGFPIVTASYTGSFMTENLPDFVLVAGSPTPGVFGPLVSGNYAAPDSTSLNPSLPGYIPPIREGSAFPDPPCFVTTTAFDPEGRVTEINGPGAHQRFHYYNGSDRAQKGNLLLTESLPNPGHNEPTVIAAASYEPLFNQRAAVVDPRAYDSSHVPAGGGPSSPDQYLTRTYFDYEEGTTASSLMTEMIAKWRIDFAQDDQRNYLLNWSLHAPTPGSFPALGDLNGDGRTDQIRGNAIRTDSPTIKIYSSPDQSSSGFSDQQVVTKVRYNDFSLVKATVDPLDRVTRYDYFPELNPTGSMATPAPSFPGAPTLNLSSVAGPDGGGFLRRTVDPLNIVQSWERDPLARIVRSVDGRNFARSTEWNAIGQVVKTIDPLGDWSERYYDVDDNLVRTRVSNTSPAILPDGSLGTPVSGAPIETFFDYDLLNQNLATRTFVTGGTGSQWIVSQNRFDKGGRLVLSLSPEWGADRQNATATVFDELGRPFQDVSGGVSTLYKNLPANANIAELAAISDSSPSVAISRSFFDADGNRIASQDEENFVSRLEYDGFNRLVRAIDPKGHSGETRFDAGGFPVESFGYQRNPDGSQMLLTHALSRFDQVGRLYETLAEAIPASALEPAGPSLSGSPNWFASRTLFDAKSQAVQTVDNRRVSRFLAYDADGRLTDGWDARGNAVSNVYDKNGNLIHTTTVEASDDPAAHHDLQRVARSYYDARNRLVATVDHRLQASRFAYDSRGNRVWESDARGDGRTQPLSSLDPLNEHPDSGAGAINAYGNTSVMSYDSLGRLTATTRHMRRAGIGGAPILPGKAGAITTRQSFDRNSRLISQSDDSENATSYVYDSRNNLTETHFADGTVERILAVSGDDLPLLVEKPNGYRIENHYDENRLLYERLISRMGAPLFGADRETFAYDGLNRLLTAQNSRNGTPLSTVNRSYDSFSHLLTETLTVPGSGVATSSLTYDEGGALRTANYPGGRRIRRSYDSIGRLSQISDATGTERPLADYAWVGGRAMRRGHWTNSGRVLEMNLAYDDLGRPVETRHTRISDGVTLDRRSYGWDAENNKTGRADLLANRNWKYDYDSNSRLIRSTMVPAAGAPVSKEYDLDGAGNRSAKMGYTMDAAADPADKQMNQYTLTPFGARRYDWNGNLEEIPGKASMSYDYRNLLVEHRNLVTNKTTDFLYDALGRRIRKRGETPGLGTMSSRYLYAGAALLEVQVEGYMAGNYSVVHGLGLDSVLEVNRNLINPYCLLADEMGNTQKVVNSGGGNLFPPGIEFGDYGELLQGSDLAPIDPNSAPAASMVHTIRFFYVGAEFDPETGFHHLRARDLEPQTGRFTTRDPLGIWGDRGNLGNGAAYAGNNPWSYRDTTGLSRKKGEPTYREQKDKHTEGNNDQSRKGDTQHWGSASRNGRGNYNIFSAIDGARAKEANRKLIGESHYGSASGQGGMGNHHGSVSGYGKSPSTNGDTTHHGSVSNTNADGSSRGPKTTLGSSAFYGGPSLPKSYGNVRHQGFKIVTVDNSPGREAESNTPRVHSYGPAGQYGGSLDSTPPGGGGTATPFVFKPEFGGECPEDGGPCAPDPEPTAPTTPAGSGGAMGPEPPPTPPEVLQEEARKAAAMEATRKLLSGGRGPGFSAPAPPRPPEPKPGILETLFGPVTFEIDDHGVITPGTGVFWYAINQFDGAL